MKMVNHPNRNKTPPDASVYRPIDAVRLLLIVRDAIEGMSGESGVTATKVAEKAMLDTYGIAPPYAKDGVYPHLHKFAAVLLEALHGTGEEFITQPLPGEDALSHSTRLRDEKAALDVHIKEMEQYISARKNPPPA